MVEVIAEISAASAEQSLGIAQVNEAIAQMDAVTEQNAALVEQSAAAAESMEGQAKELQRAVAAFELEGTEEAPHGRRHGRALPTAPFRPSASQIRPATPSASTVHG